MRELIYSENIWLNTDAPKCYLIDLNGNYVTEIELRNEVCSPVILKKMGEVETKLRWVVYSDEFTYATSIRGESFYKKEEIKKRKILPAYNYEQINLFIAENYPEIEIKLFNEQGVYVAELFQKLDKPTDSRYAEKDKKTVKTIKNGAYKAQALFDCFSLHIEKVHCIKTDSLLLIDRLFGLL